MKRLQRLRATAALRDMVSEIGFGQSQLIQPLFLSEGAVKEEPIAGLQGTSRHTLTSLLTQFDKDLAAGVRQFLLFPVPAHKSNRSFQAEFVGTALAAVIFAPVSTPFGPLTLPSVSSVKPTSPVEALTILPSAVTFAAFWPSTSITPSAWMISARFLLTSHSFISAIESVVEVAVAGAVAVVVVGVVGSTFFEPPPHAVAARTSTNEKRFIMAGPYSNFAS